MITAALLVVGLLLVGIGLCLVGDALPARPRAACACGGRIRGTHTSLDLHSDESCTLVDHLV